MTDPVKEIAQAATARLEDTLREVLAAEDGTPRAYADPISIASLIVAIASLAWNIYAELRRSPRELSDAVRARWAQDHQVDETASAVIDVVAEETVKHGAR